MALINIMQHNSGVSRGVPQGQLCVLGAPAVVYT